MGVVELAVESTPDPVGRDYFVLTKIKAVYVLALWIRAVRTCSEPRSVMRSLYGAAYLLATDTLA